MAVFAQPTIRRLGVRRLMIWTWILTVTPGAVMGGHSWAGTNDRQEVPASIPATSPAESSSPNPQQRRQLQVFRPILLSSSTDIDAETRRNAAHELIEMGVPESIEALDEALLSRKSIVMLAAISAMHAVRTPPPALLDSALAALPEAPPETLEPLSWVIARYGQAGQQRVVDMALDQSASVAGRLRPINALGFFPSRESASALVQLLDPSSDPAPAEQAEISRTACQSLERLTGLALGAEASAWRTWWGQAKEYSAEQWSHLITQSLNDRVSRLQQQLMEQRDANQHTSRELFDTYRDLYPALSIDEQLRRLPRLLGDRLAPVREFAISRVSLLLRDSVRIPPEVQHKLADCLGDEAPALRVQAAKLLDELNDDSIGAVLVARLNVEKSPEVAACLLDVLARRPSPAALDAAVKLMSDRELCDHAAQAIWRMLATCPMTEDRKLALRSAARSAVHERLSPAVVRVLAVVGDDEDVAALTDVMDGDDAAAQTAVAEGFARRGLRQPLIDRASVEFIFPQTVAVLASGPADVESLRLLVGLHPSESNKAIWTDGLSRLVSRLAVDDVIAADDVLAANPNVDPDLRRQLLMRAAETNDQKLSSADRIKLAGRLAPILIERGKPAQAHELLENAVGTAAVPELNAVQFQAAALSGHFDRAMQLQDDPHEWVLLLANKARRDAPSFDQLRQEILRRFAGRLSAADQAILNNVSANLGDHSSASAPEHAPSP